MVKCPKCKKRPAKITVRDDDGKIKWVCLDCYYKMYGG